MVSTYATTHDQRVLGQRVHHCATLLDINPRSCKPIRMFMPPMTKIELTMQIPEYTYSASNGSDFMQRSRVGRATGIVSCHGICYKSTAYTPRYQLLSIYSTSPGYDEQGTRSSLVRPLCSLASRCHKLIFRVYRMAKMAVDKRATYNVYSNRCSQ